MALGALTEVDIAGQAPSRPTYLNSFTLVGDDSYPTGGTLNFQAAVRLGTGDQVTLLAVNGYGIAAGGAISHLVRYDKATDALLVYLVATGAQIANAVDLSATTFHLTAIGQ
jgi:hypothetical protein